MKAVSLALLLIVAGTATAQQERCWASACYTFKEEPTDIESALRGCLSEGALLVTVDSAAEEAYLYESIEELGLDITHVWVGYIDQTKDNQYNNILNGKPLVYTNWLKGEPNNVDEQCVTMVVNAKKWVDVQCKTKRSYVCKKEQELPEKCREGGSCYTFFNAEASKSTATAQCNDLGGGLIALDDQAEEEFLWQSLEDLGVKVNHVWIGIEDRTADNEFTYDKNDQPLAYTNWLKGEPNKVEEACATMTISTKQWVDVRCNTERNFICEIEPEVPEVTCEVSPESRSDCGYPGITQAECESNENCCFDNSIVGVKWCFYAA